MPLEREARLQQLHGRAPVERHLRVLYGQERVGTDGFVDLYLRCLESTGTAVTPFNVFQRFQTRWEMLRYLEATLPIEGGRAECGVYRGASALLLCHALRAWQPDFRGRGMYLVDSFKGTLESSEDDLIPVRGEDGRTEMRAFFAPGRTDASAALAAEALHEFPEVDIRCGWIPEVLDALPEQPWAFVHLDVTLYEATLASLAYFYPRLAPGGVIFADGSPFVPGVEKAFERYCEDGQAHYVVLGHGEMVMLRA
jgi:O-methyltransferase